MQLCCLFPFYRRLSCCRFLAFAQFGVLGRDGLVVRVDEHGCYFLESLFDVFCSFCACFDILNFLMFLKEGLHQFSGYCPAVVEIGLVADEQYLCFGWAGAAYFVVPVVGGIFEGLFVGEVEHNQEGMCPAVVGTGDGAETFVAGSVPDLQFYLVAAQGERFESEVDPDRGQEHLAELVVRVTHHD